MGLNDRRATASSCRSLFEQSGVSCNSDQTGNDWADIIDFLTMWQEYDSKVRAQVVLAVVASVAVIGTVAILGVTENKQVVSEHAAAAPQSPSSAQVTLPAPPQCPSTGQPTHDLTISTERGSKMALTNGCAYAPVGEDFTITFENEVVALSDGKGTEQNLSIYPDQDSAITPISDGWAVNHKKALFVGDEVLGPGTIVYRVSALPAGTYYVQSDFAPDKLVATLVVE